MGWECKYRRKERKGGRLRNFFAENASSCLGNSTARQGVGVDIKWYPEATLTQQTIISNLIEATNLTFLWYSATKTLLYTLNVVQYIFLCFESKLQFPGSPFPTPRTPTADRKTDPVAKAREGNQQNRGCKKKEGEVGKKGRKKRPAGMGFDKISK